VAIITARAMAAYTPLTAMTDRAALFYDILDAGFLGHFLGQSVFIVQCSNRVRNQNTIRLIFC